MFIENCERYKELEKSKREKGLLVRRNTIVEKTESKQIESVIRRSKSLLNCAGERKCAEAKKIDRFSLPYYPNQKLLLTYTHVETDLTNNV